MSNASTPALLTNEQYSHVASRHVLPPCLDIDSTWLLHHNTTKSNLAICLVKRIWFCQSLLAYGACIETSVLMAPMVAE